MIAEIYEIDVELLRDVLNDDKDVLEQLWQKLLPSALLLLYNHQLIELPDFLSERTWNESIKLLKNYSKVNVLDINEEIKLPAGGFLLQGSIEQLIEEVHLEKSPASGGKKTGKGGVLAAN